MGLKTHAPSETATCIESHFKTWYESEIRTRDLARRTDWALAVAQHRTMMFAALRLKFLGAFMFSILVSFRVKRPGSAIAVSPVAAVSQRVIPGNTSSGPASHRCLRAIGPLAFLLILLAALGLTACGGSSSSSTSTTTTTTTSGTPDARADAMLAQMTQAEKLQMVQGGVTTNLTYGYTVPLARRDGCRPTPGWGFRLCIWRTAVWAWAME